MLLLLLGGLQAQEPVKTPVILPVPVLVVRLENVEVTPDRRNLLAHVTVRNPGRQTERVYWQDFLTLVSAGGELVRPPTDAGVDQGQGLVRTFGSFDLPAGGKIRMVIYFPLQPADLPARLRLSDERETRPYR